MVDSDDTYKHVIRPFNASSVSRQYKDNKYMSTIVDNKDIIDRKAASRLLKVSMRTIDRYRQSGQITTQIRDNKIFLSKSEILEFIQKTTEKLNRQSRQEKNSKMASDRPVDSVALGEDTSTSDDTYTFVNTRTVPPDAHRDIESHPRDIDLIDTYKKMYEEISLELRRRQEELEGAHYRIGQLEGQLRYSIPLPEHKGEILKLTESAQGLEKDITEKQIRLKKIREVLYYEKLNKRIYLIVILSLLALQPLWLYLSHR